MKRKIVQHGSSSLTITLPIQWVQQFKLQKGDELAVEVAGNTLLISTNNTKSVSKKVFSAKDSGIFTKNNLSHLYHLGYDEVEVIVNDMQTLAEIKQRIPELIGFEIIEQKKDRLQIKSIMTTLEAEYDTLLRKAFLVTNDMAKEIVTALQQGKYDKLAELRTMEAQNNKFTDICARILNKKGYKIQQRTMQAYEIVKAIERIADEFKYLCDALQNHTGELATEIITGFSEAVQYYLDFYQLFYKFDPELKKRLYLDKKLLCQKFKENLENSHGKEAVVLHYCMTIVQRTYDGAGAYFALVL